MGVLRHHFATCLRGDFASFWGALTLRLNSGVFVDLYEG
jgi:hypothetical protein